MSKVNFLNIPIDALSMKQTVKLIDLAIEDNKHIHHTVVNAGKIVKMQTDEVLFESVINADLINADGQAVVWALQILGKKIPGRVAGVDLMEKLVEKAHAKGYKCFFLGAKEEVVSDLVKKYKLKYSKDIIGGYRNGYFDENEEKKNSKSDK